MAKKKQQKKKVDLFHGGVPGLSRGSELLPAAKLPSGLPLSYENRFLYENAQPELIYLTADPLVARSYAARWVGRAEEGERRVDLQGRNPRTLDAGLGLLQRPRHLLVRAHCLRDGGPRGQRSPD